MTTQGMISQKEAQAKEKEIHSTEWADRDRTLGGVLSILARTEQPGRLTIFGPSRVEDGEVKDREGIILEGLAAIDPDKVNEVLRRLYPNGVPVGEDIFEYFNY